MNRRSFFIRSGLAAGASALLPRFMESVQAPSSVITFETSEALNQKTYAAALDVLSRNITQISGYPMPVLIEGGNYPGIWLECAPHEGLTYAVVRPDVARNNHLAFFA